jgi:hypothetical protein
MFDSEDFREYESVLPLVDKLNRYLKKEKHDKVLKIINDLYDLLNNEKLAIPITYIFSVLAEDDIELIKAKTIQKIEDFLMSEDEKLQLNSIIIIGFYMLKNQKRIESFLPKFIELLEVKSNEVLENVYFFLLNILEIKPKIFCSYKNGILQHLKYEKNEKNQLSLLKFIEPCSDFGFDELYEFKYIASQLFSQYKEKNELLIYSTLISILSSLFPSFKDGDFEEIDYESLINEINNLFIMKKYNLTKISKEENINLKEFINRRKKSPLNENIISFYIQNKEENQSFFYEIEKSGFTTFFDSSSKISGDSILATFSQIIKNESELKLFMKTLLKLKIIDGYFSDLNFFYPYIYLKDLLLKDIQEKGLVRIDKYNYIPLEVLRDIIKDISENTKEILLIGKNEKSYYSLKKIIQNINITAAKKSSIDLKSYQERLSNKEFLELVKNLPKDYLSKFHKETQYLTNLGLIKVKKEIDNSKIIGYFSVSEISIKLKIYKSIILDILEDSVDLRSGIFDANRDNFYYSKFLNEKFNEINKIKEESKRNDYIIQLAKRLNINENVIFSKLNENLEAIGKEIEASEEIDINEYIEKSGMDYVEFIDFIRNLGINYFKKGDRIIINQDRINDAKSEIKLLLIEKAKSEDLIAFNELELTSRIVKELLLELIEEQKISGILYNDGDKIQFYTKKGVENLMLENREFFSFYDFFPNKELSESELEILLTILNDLIRNKKLSGNFDKQNLIFSSSEIIFAQNYNTMLSEFENIIKKYIEIFRSEFQKVKKILIKKDETILPNEIKIIQEVINRINSKYVHWRSGLDAYVRKANIQLLKKQGLSLKKYKTIKISPDIERDIKIFEEDPEVVDLLNNFKEWVKIFNNIELKYGNVIFYQKRLILNPNNKEDSKKLQNLLIQLKLI